MSPLKVAIVGAGNIAGGYDENKIGDDGGNYTHAGAYHASGKFHLDTVFDLNTGRAEAFRDHWGVGQVAYSLDQIRSGFHDVISVCTPDSTHLEIAKQLLEAGCCKTLLVEKPLALERDKVALLADLATKRGVYLVVNFQRRWEHVHCQLRDRIGAHSEQLLSVAGCYIKGLKHIGVTMIDTLTFLCGYPLAVRALSRVYNRQAQDDTYEFILRYPNFNVLVRTVDVPRFEYSYHIFEIDLLFTDRRLTILDNSQAIRESVLEDYAYSGVKVLGDSHASCGMTGYKSSMLEAVEYVYRITTGAARHDTNTPMDSWNDLLIVDYVIESYKKNCAELAFNGVLWKR